MIPQFRQSSMDQAEFDKHLQHMEDMKRAYRIQGRIYDPLYDPDLSNFNSRRTEDDDSVMGCEDDVSEPRILEDVWDSNDPPPQREIQDGSLYSPV